MFVINTMKTLIAAISGLAILSQLALATPTPLTQRDVIAPKITYPDATSEWHVGEVETVTWDTSNFPPDSQITNPIGKIYLGYEENDSLNLDINHPLASGFKLRDGKVQITVPDVPPKDNYLIVLFGDSGNTSPSFTITKISGGANPPANSVSSGNTPTSTSTVASTPVPASPSLVLSSSVGSATSFASFPTSSASVSSASSSPSTSSGSSTGTLGASNSSPTSGATSSRPVHFGSMIMTAGLAGILLFVL